MRIVDTKEAARGTTRRALAVMATTLTTTMKSTGMMNMQQKKKMRTEKEILETIDFVVRQLNLTTKQKKDLRVHVDSRDMGSTVCGKHPKQYHSIVSIYLYEFMSLEGSTKIRLCESCMRKIIKLINEDNAQEIERLLWGESVDGSNGKLLN